MAWIEQRHRKYVPYARIEGRKVPGPRFGTREEAEMFLRLAELAGSTTATGGGNGSEC